LGLRLDDAHSELIGAVEPELRVAAEAIGMGLRAELGRLAPGLTRPPETGGASDATLLSLDLDHEGPPDGLSLIACVAAHRAYVISRGAPEGLSAGALALARLLVWSQRAALLGPAPRITWIGPAPRRPEDTGDNLLLAARCSLDLRGATRKAEAVALIAPPDAAPGS
jgi:hypothetical protein